MASGLKQGNSIKKLKSIYRLVKSVSGVSLTSAVSSAPVSPSNSNISSGGKSIPVMTIGPGLPLPNWWDPSSPPPSTPTVVPVDLKSIDPTPSWDPSKWNPISMLGSWLFQQLFSGEINSALNSDDPAGNLALLGLSTGASIGNFLASL